MPTQQALLTEAWEKLINSTCLIPSQVSLNNPKKKRKENNKKSTVIIISLAPESARPFLALLPKNTRGNGKK